MTHAGLRRTAIPLALCLNRAYGRSRRYAALYAARGVCTGNVSHCGHVRDSALPGVCTRLCVPLRPCARFCIAGRMYAFMRPLAAMCTILRRWAYVPFMRPFAAMCTILRRRAYVRVYASSCGHVHDSASPGVCTRLCVLLRPCARFCAGRMYAFMRPLATERAILRRAYVRAYACALPRCRALANTSASPCAHLRIHAPAKTKTSSRTHRIRTSVRAKCPRVCPCGR